MEVRVKGLTREQKNETFLGWLKYVKRNAEERGYDCRACLVVSTENSTAHFEVDCWPRTGIGLSPHYESESVHEIVKKIRALPKC